ncbi:cyclic nucleotide-binding domain-containing protein [Usitatibacter palustris]|uniref:Ferredoxin--NADP reductase n=1 Tax=Usitatibacter palustris TaxID=2732487 RepID=A0A6M4H6N8_9PROT|nr:cyclic nucleotide-binding domain-containing protein [Usitatibacter palustris]QJR15022.1 Ferredoxin--NADP reductase [Usitatibacter palustris]
MSTPFDPDKTFESQWYKIGIIGSGPAGLSAAAHCAKRGISHIVFEAQPQASNTIYKYQKGKHVMAEPQILPLRSELTFAAGAREKILDTWNDEIARAEVNIVYNAEVVKVEGKDGAFEVHTKDGQTYLCRKLVLAIGLQGNLRKLGVAGEDFERVQYQLDDPKEYLDETIVVVGAGDAAIENAVALAEQNQVILINRNEEFARCKEGNLSLILAAIKEGRIECRYGSSAIKVEETGGDVPLRFSVKSPDGPDTIECHRVIARLGGNPPRKLVESFGVTFPRADANAVPELSERYESNVKGLYIIGALGGYPLIKQAMNQGYEVVEFALGQDIEPADEPLLKRKFAGFSRKSSVREVLDLIQASVPLLSDLTRLQLREFLLESDLLVPKEDDIIFQRNDYTNSFFMVVAGEALVETTRDGRKGWFALGPGEFFGELGLISGRRRSGTVKAGRDCVLLEAPRRPMLKLIASVESVRKQIDDVFLKRAVRAYLAPMLPAAELDELIAEGVQVRKYGGGEVLFNEGDASDGLYLIRRGSVMISRMIAGREVVLSYLSAGNYVGEMALLTDSPRSATVKAAVTTEAVVLEATAFKRVIARNPAWRAELESRFLDRLRINAAMESQPNPGNIIAFLLQQGVGEATDVLLIDESLCIRCDNCEKACADVHGGTSRLNREAGPTFAQIHVPTTCRHCEHPHCMKDCPPDAIHRSANGEVFVNDTCIGCGNCEKNCPYGVIQMAAVDPKRTAPSLMSWLMFGVGPEPGREPKPKSKDIPKKAVKCDMCRDLPGGAACVRACPTGAALRVSPESFLGYTAASE